MHRRRLLVGVGASALLLLGTLPLPALAAGPMRTPDKVEISKIDPKVQPRYLDQAKHYTVMLELVGRPAVSVGSSRADQEAQAVRLRSSQRTIVTAVRGTGARVIARYQYAYNGLRVRATAAELSKLAALPAVKAIHAIPKYRIDNVNGVPAIGAPSAWENAGATGAGTIVAVVDTGIDYTHANFGGEGTANAYDTNDPTTVEGGSFPTPKVIAGYDFAGNNYDADNDVGSDTPTPDADPLDCNGHGSHVAGTVAGKGVLADHSTYGGLYDQSTIGDPTDWVIGPGVAPEAKLVALKVFGCEGSTDLVVDALEWVAEYNTAHVVGIDVVNMSLGSPFGEANAPDSVATNNLVGSGVVVVASAGNEAAVPYITGAPGVATQSISVAALDANATLPMATIDNSGADIDGLNQNAYPALPVTGDLFVVSDDGATPGTNEFLGCSASDYPAGAAGKIVVVKRGVCAFVDKGAAAEAAGAIGIVVINRDDLPAGALPTFIGYNPEIFDIPMVGVGNEVQDALIAIDGESVTLVDAGSQANPAFDTITTFSSSGPRWSDAALKPDVAAPGASVVSTLVGGGWQGTTLSGTSMAAPMTSGAAALVVQGHPGWSPLKVKAALVNTADADTVVGYDPERAGSGLVAVDKAVDVNVVATTSDGTASLSYGYQPVNGAWSLGKTITFWNDGKQSATFSLAASTSLVHLSASSVTVPAGGSASVTATASLSAAALRAMDSADDFVTGNFIELASMDGVVVATPSGSIAGQHSLRVPYLVVPRGVSNVQADTSASWSTSAGVTSGKLLFENKGLHSGFADVYALGLKDPKGDGGHGMDVRAAGVQTLPGAALGGDATDRSLLFAVTMHSRFSNVAPHEVDVLIDNNLDGDADFVLVGVDLGYLTAAAWNGLMVTALYDLNAGGWVTDADDNLVYWFNDAPRNGSTVLMPVLASWIGITDASGAFDYAVMAWDGFTGIPDLTSTSQTFDPFSPAISTGTFKLVASGDTAKAKAWFKKAAAPRGWLVITLDDRNGAAQGDIVKLP